MSSRENRNHLEDCKSFFLRQWQIFVLLAVFLLLKTAQIKNFEIQDFRLFLSEENRQLMAEHPVRWLGIVEYGGPAIETMYFRWSATGLGLVALLLTAGWTSNFIYLFLLLVNVILAYVLSYRLLRDNNLSILFAAFVAFGPQFLGAILNAQSLTFLPLYIYLQINFYFLLKIFLYQDQRKKIWFGFLVSLLFLSLSWAQWLDYFVFLFVATLVFPLFFKQEVSKRPLGAALVFAILYLLCIFQSGSRQEHSMPGAEAELLFTYFRDLSFFKALVMAASDFLTNIFTYVYLAVSAALPPYFSVSPALSLVGDEARKATQHGYHQSFQHFNMPHYLLTWYMLAGVTITLLMHQLVKIFRSGKHATIIMRLTALCILLILTGSSTHYLVKWRPYLSAPTLYYKSIIATLGVFFLFSLLVSKFRGSKWITLLCIVVLVVGSIYQMRYLDILSTYIGMPLFP